MGFRWGLVLSLVLFFSLACFAESTPTHQNSTNGSGQNQNMPALKSNPISQMMGAMSSMGSNKRSQRGASGQDDSEAFAKQIAEGTKKVGETANKAQSDFSAAMQRLNEDNNDSSKSVASSLGKITESIGNISSSTSNSQASVDAAYSSLLQTVNGNGSQTSALTAALQQQQQSQTGSNNQFSNERFNPDPLGFAFLKTQRVAEEIRPGNNFIHNTYSAPAGISLR